MAAETSCVVTGSTTQLGVTACSWADQKDAEVPI